FHIRPPTPHIYPLSLHDALPISLKRRRRPVTMQPNVVQSLVSPKYIPSLLRLEMEDEESDLADLQISSRSGFHRKCREIAHRVRSEEHTSELQSLAYLVCRLLLE